MTENQEELARQRYRVGREAFERGRYRESIEQFQSSVELVGRNSILGGQAQVWMVSAFEALEKREEAIALCESITRHPHDTTRKEAKRLLYILKAPRLKIRPEWRTEIPDLTQLEGGERASAPYAKPTKKRSPSRRKPKPEPEPIDLSQVNTRDNGFIWVGLLAIATLFAGLFWFGM
ncbi:MAG: hypothetical protein AAFX78_09085 [Cyanobacteria bacterium J06638_20]